MNLQTVTYRIIGKKPLLQDNPAPMWDAPEEVKEVEGTTTPKKTRKKKTLRGTDTEEFKRCQRKLYLTEDGHPCHPSNAFQKCLLLASHSRTFFGKQKEDGTIVGGREGVEVMGTAVCVAEDEFVLYDPVTFNGKQQPKPLSAKGWQMHQCKGINSNAKPRPVGIVVLLVKWKMWGGLLRLRVDTDALNLDLLTEVMNIAGEIFGVGVGRRQLKKLDRYNRAIQWTDLGMGRFSAELIG